MSIEETMFQMLNKVEENRQATYSRIIDLMVKGISNTLENVGANKYDKKACLEGLIIRINNKLKELE